MKIMKSTYQKVVAVSFFGVLAACGGGDGDGGDGGTAILDGVFVDSPVEGMGYESVSVSGVTDATGRFQYEASQTVTFTVGGIIIGNGTGKATMTPVDLVAGAVDTSDPMVVNIAQFLQSLDDNGNPTDGIKITSIQRDLAQGRSIDFDQSGEDFQTDGNVQTIIADLTAATSAGARVLVSRAGAKSHLDSSIEVNPTPDPNPGSAGAWIGDWVQVNFIAESDGGVFDADDTSPEGIGFVATVTNTQWTESDNFGEPGGCTDIYALTVSSDQNTYRKLLTSTTCSYPSFALEYLQNTGLTGTLEFSDGDNFMIDHFDPIPGDDCFDCLVAFKYRRR